jgi:hypothetical protein
LPVTAFTITIRPQREEQLRGSVDFSMSPRTFEDSLGQFLYENVRAGDYAIHVQANGFAPAEEDNINVYPGKVASVRFVLDQGYVVGGIVLEEGTGEPIAGARVHHSRVREESGEPRPVPFFTGDNRVTTDEEGAFVIAGLAEGAYVVNVTHSLHYRDGTPIRFELPGAEAGELEITMKQAGVVAGTLRGFPEGQTQMREYYLISLTRTGGKDAKGKRAGAKAEKTESRPPYSTMTYVPPGGAFRAEGLRPGIYRVELQKRSITANTEIPGERPRTEEKIPLGEVEAKAGTVETVEFDMPAAWRQPASAEKP